MIKFSQKRMEEIFYHAAPKKILVLGDVMVDEYLWGNVSRLSPEAPVPIVSIENEQLRFGGAANVAYNIMGLNATPIIVGIVGNDRMGQIFREMMLEKNLPTDGIVAVDDRPTTTKTRIIGDNQHIARVDKESTAPISGEIQDRLFKICLDYLDEVDAIIIEDYNKGVVVPALIEKLVDTANRQGKIVTVDPKFENFLSFKNVTVFKPNTKETEEALAMRIRSEDDLLVAGEKLLKELNSESVLITRGPKGMALFQRDEVPYLVETFARKVADVSGAGDTVIATLTMALAGGASLKEAVSLANYAAGIVCEEVGAVPIELEKLSKIVLAL
ncbi:MAG: D-glycero-beta-D-manno-heptose-7-phosphate kinase [Calditrichia bacterium]